MREICTLRCDAEGAGNVARPRYWDTRRRKCEPRGETNFGLNRSASPRPYREEATRDRPPKRGTALVAYFTDLRPAIARERFLQGLDAEIGASVLESRQVSTARLTQSMITTK